MFRRVRARHYDKLNNSLILAAQYTYLMYEKLDNYHNLFELFTTDDNLCDAWMAHCFIACIGPMLNTKYTVQECSKYSYKLIMLTLYSNSKKIIDREKSDCDPSTRRAELKTNIIAMLYGLLLHTCLTSSDSNFGVYQNFIIAHCDVIETKYTPVIDAIPRIRATHTPYVEYIAAIPPDKVSLFLNFDQDTEDMILKRCRSIYISAGLNPDFGEIVGEIIDKKPTYKIELIFNSIYAFMNAYLAFDKAKIRVYTEGPNYIIVAHTKKSNNNINAYDINVNKNVFRGVLGIPGTRSWAFSEYILIYSEKRELRERQYNLFSRSMSDYSLLESDIKELSK